MPLHGSFQGFPHTSKPRTEGMELYLFESGVMNLGIGADV